MKKRFTYKDFTRNSPVEERSTERRSRVKIAVRKRQREEASSTVKDTKISNKEGKPAIPDEGMVPHKISLGITNIDRLNMTSGKIEVQFFNSSYPCVKIWEVPLKREKIYKMLIPNGA